MRECARLRRDAAEWTRDAAESTRENATRARVKVLATKHVRMEQHTIESQQFESRPFA